MSSLKGNPVEETPKIFREAILYREWGYRLISLGRYPSAIAYFEKALKLTEVDDLRMLVGLCRALTTYTRYHAAGELLERCMKIDPGHYKVKQMRMKALFQSGEFCHSLVNAYEGMRQRRLTFEHGVYQAKATIEDCIGRNTSPVVMLLLCPWIRRLCEYRMHLIGKLEGEADEFEDADDTSAFESISIGGNESVFKVNDPEVRQKMRMKKLQRARAKRYLGYLANDKHFLERIANKPENMTAESIALASECHLNVSYLQELLRMRRPLYVTFIERKAIWAQRHSEILEWQRKLRTNNIVIEADFLLRRLHAARVNKDYLRFYRAVDRVKDKFDLYSDNVFPLKQKYLNALYEMVSWVYIDARDLTCLDEEMKMMHLKHHVGIRVNLLLQDSDIAWLPIRNPEESLKQLRRIYNYNYERDQYFRDDLNIRGASRRLAVASTPLELAWLYHELCKLFIDIRRFDLARFYGKKAHDTAQRANSTHWMLNAHHLTLRIEVHQNNRNEAKDAAMSALANAKELNIDHLIDFYERAINFVDELDIERVGDFDAVAARQQLILELMPKELKEEVDFLWRRMDVVPAKRRLSVMPGCKPIDRKREMTSRRRTILPSPPRDPERDARIARLRQHEPHRKRLGFVNFEEFE